MGRESFRRGFLVRETDGTYKVAVYGNQQEEVTLEWGTFDFLNDEVILTGMSPPQLNGKKAVIRYDDASKKLKVRVIGESQSKWIDVNVGNVKLEENNKLKENEFNNHRKQDDSRRRLSTKVSTERRRLAANGSDVGFTLFQCIIIVIVAANTLLVFAGFYYIHAMMHNNRARRRSSRASVIALQDTTQTTKGQISWVSAWCSSRRKSRKSTWSERVSRLL